MAGVPHSGLLANQICIKRSATHRPAPLARPDLPNKPDRSLPDRSTRNRE